MDSKGGGWAPQLTRAGLPISRTAINSKSGLLHGKCLSAGNIAELALTSPATRLLSLFFPPLYSRDHGVLETIVDVTAWHFLCKERTRMWAQGGGGKLPLKPQRLRWLGAGARLFFWSLWNQHGESIWFGFQKKHKPCLRVCVGGVGMGVSCLKVKVSLRLRGIKKKIPWHNYSSSAS